MNDVVLLSGGLDSTLCLYLARLRGPVLALNVDYGQLAAVSEDRLSKMFAHGIGVSYRHMAIPQIGAVVRSALLGVGDTTSAAETVVPGRNAALLSLAAGVAVSVGAKRVWIGCNAGDAEHYPDCRPQFLAMLGSALEAAYGVSIEAPLLGSSKADVVRRARAIGVPVAATSSCYHGSNCGKCHACKVRKEAENG